jgi:2-C-methyl-D-erythritol 4-phosphate cytidylyltransferase
MVGTESASAIIVAAGESRRMNGLDKLRAPLGGKPLLYRSLAAFQDSPLIDRIVLVVGRGNLVWSRELVAAEGLDKVAEICAGGERRQDSVAAGLARLHDCKWVLIHDGARPLVTADLIERGLRAVKTTVAAVAAVPVTDTIKVSDGDGNVRQTLSRQNLRAVQTPQVFRTEIIREAYHNAQEDVTDDASLVERMGRRVTVYMGSYDNIKVTTPDDLVLAEALWRRRNG